MAQKQFRFNEKCSAAYLQIISLKLQPAAKIVAAEKIADPNNLVPYFLENYIDFFTLFFNEDKKLYDVAKPMLDKRLSLMKEGPEQSPLTLFTQAIIHLQWAAIETKFNNKWNAGWHFKDAFKLAKYNSEKFPGFTPNKMITGPMQMVAATIPKSMRWLSSIMGINGTMQQGKTNLDYFLNANDAWAKLYRNEGIFYHCYLQYYLLNQPDDALAFIAQHNLDVVNNHMFAYMAANLNLNSKKSWITQQIVNGRNTSPEYLKTPIWDFEMAYAKLYHLEPDAPVYFQRFLQNFKGDFYVKDAWLKLGYHYLVQGQTAQYKSCMQKVISEGNTASDADKRALKEAKLGIVPNLLLLKARLLSDGGFSNDALQLMQGTSSAQFTDMAEKLEYSYRLGRIYDELGQDDRAIKSYEITIAAGAERTEYFAARAALQCGMIFEKKGDKKTAAKYYARCIAMQDHDYEESIEQKAKAGQERCKQ
ncbi:MAG TPA: tetratricopeptide repeat protein [Phnomibacter sp.]|nr:tetratricopeptide repeat protein [Phnomibacter sp.]